MKENTYKIELQTPLGKRKGTLFTETDGQKLDGWLDILKHREPFEGNVNEDGTCKISGELVTLMNRMPYAATGQISGSVIHLNLKCGRNMFELTGTACPESEESK